MDALVLEKIANQFFVPLDLKTLSSLCCTCRHLRDYLKDYNLLPHAVQPRWPIYSTLVTKTVPITWFQGGVGFSRLDGCQFEWILKFK